MQLFENTFIDRTQNAFSDQFEKTDTGYVYRSDQKGPAVPVSDDERNAFVKSYGIKFYASAFVFVAALIGTVFAVGTYTDQMENKPSDTVSVSIVGGACFIWLILFCFTVYTLWTVPSRALSRRSAVQMDRSIEEAAKARVSKISWGQLGMGAVAVCFLTFKFGQKYDLTQGLGLIFSILIAAGIAVLVWQAIRKWKIERA